MKTRLTALVLAVLLLAACATADRPLTAQELLDLGEKYLLELDYEQALVQFIKLIEIEPMNIRGYLGGTDAYVHLAQMQEAEDWLAKGIEATDNKNLPLVLSGVQKSEIEAYIALAEAYEAEGWYDKALELLRRVFEETGDEIIGRKLGIVEASDIQFRENYAVVWKDAALERLIRRYLGKESGDIHYDDVKLIEEIEIWGQTITMPDDPRWVSYSEDWFSLANGNEGSKNGEIQTLADLEHFTSLKKLTVNHQTDLDISALADTESIDCLARLTTLSLIADSLTDISVVSHLIALRSLSISYNDVVDISPISMLIELTSIQISNNEQLASAEPLRGLRKLSSASVSNVARVDLNVFVGMPELRRLNLVRIESVDYSLLTKLNLTYLEISCDNAVFQIVKQLTTLESLRLHGWSSWDPETQLQSEGLTSLAGIEQLSRLTKLDLLAGECRDISPLASLSLEELELDVSDECDLTPLTRISSLKTVYVRDDHQAPDAPDASAGERLLDRLRALLPSVEVTTKRH